MERALKGPSPVPGFYPQLDERPNFSKGQLLVLQRDPGSVVLDVDPDAAVLCARDHPYPAADP